MEQITIEALEEHPRQAMLNDDMQALDKLIAKEVMAAPYGKFCQRPGN